jgi:hypothetical protein
MKIHYIVLSAALFLITTACEQKKPVQTEAPAAPVINAEQKAPEPAEQKNEVKKEPAKTEKADKALPPKVESSENKSPVAVQVTTEQSLSDISKHGREVTKSQESKTRTRAQIAEDEMQNDLKNFK